MGIWVASSFHFSVINVQNAAAGLYGKHVYHGHFHFTFPPAVHGSSNFSAFSPTVRVLIVLSSSHSDRCVKDRYLIWEAGRPSQTMTVYKSSHSVSTF